MVPGYINGMVPAWVSQSGCKGSWDEGFIRASSGIRRASPGM